MPILTQAVGADKGELYVTEIPQKKEHFNLYYIYKEDKQRNILPTKTVAEICIYYQKLEDNRLNIRHFSKDKNYTKPTLLPLPLFADVKDNPSNNQKWYTFDYKSIKGY